MKKVAIGLAVIIVVLVAILIFWPAHKQPASTDQATVIAAPIVSSDGHVSVSQPYANTLVVSPVTVQGTVLGGGWFFEGSFPVQVLDKDGTVIGNGIAEAQGDWTSTTTSVGFTALVSYTAPKSATGKIMLSKDNPSGDPKNDLSLIIPVRFK